MSILNGVIKWTEKIEELNGITEALKKLNEAEGSIDTAAAASQLAAELAITAAVTATVRTAMSLTRLGLAISGKIWQWEAISYAAGVGTGIGAGAIIDWVNEQGIGEKIYDWTHDEVITGIKTKTNTAATIPSPIILDLDGNGVQTTAVTTGTNSGGTHFDHAADGFAEQTGWVGRGDGFLVRDLNGNSKIDTGRELFGSETLLKNGSKAANGFEALAELDTNADNKIDSQDAAYASLRIWKDADGDAATDEGELLTLVEAGVQSINVGYSDSTTVDTQGNQHRQVGSYTNAAGQSGNATDVWFTTDTTFTIATDRIDVPTDIAALPNAKGYGLVRDLHQAMAHDSSGVLQGLVSQFTQEGWGSLASRTDSARYDLTQSIIYQWAGVQDVDSASRALDPFYGTDGATGNAAPAHLTGSLLLANNNFYREFTDNPAITAQAMSLPQMRGSGMVRDMRAAASASNQSVQSIFKQLDQLPCGYTKRARKLNHGHDGRHAYAAFQHGHIGAVNTRFKCQSFLRQFSIQPNLAKQLTSNPLHTQKS